MPVIYWEEVRKIRNQGYPRLHRELEASLRYLVERKEGRQKGRKVGRQERVLLPNLSLLH